MTNALQDRLVKELTEREQLLNDKLARIEEIVGRNTPSGHTLYLDKKADAAACELTDIDEVLRLLEAR